MTTTIHYNGPATVEVIGSGSVTVQRQGGVYAWEADGATGRVNNHAGSQILALVLGGMALERMAPGKAAACDGQGGETASDTDLPSRPGATEFVHPHWTELFTDAEAYLAWREAQGTAATEPTA